MGLKGLKEIREWIKTLPTAKHAIKQGDVDPLAGREEEYIVADDILTRLFSVHNEDMSTMFTSDQLFDKLMFSAFTHLRGRCSTYVIMCDIMELVPMRKYNEQAKRSERTKPYERGSTIVANGVVENGRLDLIDANRLAASRHMRWQWMYFMLKRLQKTDIGQDKQIMLMFDRRGPISVKNKKWKLHGIDYAHAFGEPDLMAPFVYALNRKKTLLVQTTDSDTLPIFYNLVESLGEEAIGDIIWLPGTKIKRKDKGKGKDDEDDEDGEELDEGKSDIAGYKRTNSVIYWDLKELYAGIKKDVGWNGMMFMIASIFGGTDFVQKNTVSYFINWAKICTEMLESTQLIEGLEIDITEFKEKQEEYWHILRTGEEDRMEKGFSAVQLERTDEKKKKKDSGSNNVVYASMRENIEAFRIRLAKRTNRKRPRKDAEGKAMSEEAKMEEADQADAQMLIEAEKADEEEEKREEAPGQPKKKKARVMPPSSEKDPDLAVMWNVQYWAVDWKQVKERPFTT